MDPRSSLVYNQTIASQMATANLISNINAPGNVAAASIVGSSTTGLGIATLATISNIVQTGSPQSYIPASGLIPAVSVNSFLALTPPQGGVAVQGIVDPTGQVGSFLSSVDPVSAAAATASYVSVFNSVRSGSFTPSLGASLLSTTISGAASLASSFGSYGLNNVTSLFGAVTGSGTKPVTDDMGIRYATGFNSIGEIGNTFSPKFKFLFIVEFKFHPELIAHSVNTIGFDIGAASAAFLIKEATRPNYSIEYEEVNMYNYRTRVMKEFKHENATFKFYDDNQDNVMTFAQLITRTLNPIGTMPKTNVSTNETNQFDLINNMTVTSINDDTSSSSITQQGAQSSGNVAPDVTYDNYLNFRAGSVAALNLTQLPYSLFTEINLYHVYNFGANCTMYTYSEPQLVAMQMSAMDMADSESSDITMEFAYNALRIQHGFEFPGPSSASSVSPKTGDLADAPYNVQTLSGYGNALPIGQVYVQPTPVPLSQNPPIPANISGFDPSTFSPFPATLPVAPTGNVATAATGDQFGLPGQNVTADDIASTALTYNAFNGPTTGTQFIVPNGYGTAVAQPDGSVITTTPNGSTVIGSLSGAVSVLPSSPISNTTVNPATPSPVANTASTSTADLQAAVSELNATVAAGRGT